MTGPQQHEVCSGHFGRFFSKKSTIYLQYFGEKMSSMLIKWKKKIRDLSPYIDISSIYWWFLANFFSKYCLPDISHLDIVSMSPNTQYIHDISSIFTKIFVHGGNRHSRYKTLWYIIGLRQRVFLSDPNDMWS